VICILNVNPHQISTSTVKSLLAEDRYDFIERRSHVNINHARNQLVYDFILSDHKWGLLLDSDLVFPPGAISRLHANCLASSEVQIVSAVYGQPRKNISLTTHPDGTPWPDFPTDTLIESGPTGVGFMLVHRQVFEAIQKQAWNPKSPSPNAEFPWFREAVENHMWISEDTYFCRRAQELDFKIYTDTSLILGHQKSDGAVYYPQSVPDPDA
jgi:hypothetical protein